ncbi:MAG: PKD domain-containing protein [Bacteroidota bacterium]
MQNTKQFLLFLVCFCCVSGKMLGQFSVDLPASVTLCQGGDYILYVMPSDMMPQNHTFVWQFDDGGGFTNLSQLTTTGTNSYVLSNISSGMHDQNDYRVLMDGTPSTVLTITTGTNSAVLNNAIDNAPLDYCDNESLDLTATITQISGGAVVTPGGTLTWYSGADRYQLTELAQTTAGGTVTPSNLTDNLVVVQFRQSSNSCFSKIDTSLLTVNTAPTVNAGGNLDFCTNDPVFDMDTHGATPSGAGGVWSGTGVLNNMFDPDAPTNPGNYPLTYTYTDGNGCSDSDMITVDLTAAPEANAGTDESLCENDGPITLTPSPGSGDWVNPPNALTGNDFDPAVSGDGDFTLTYSVTQNGCTDQDQATITVHPEPTAIAGGNLTRCANDAPFALGGVATGGTGIWSGDGVVSGGTMFDPSQVASSSQHKVYFTVTSPENCEAVDSLTITVNGKPAMPTISASSEVCEGESSQLTATVNGVTNPDYSWYYNPALLVEEGTQSTHTVPSVTLGFQVYVTVTDPSTTCTGDARVFAVPVNENPTAGIGLVSSAEVCETEMHIITASSTSSGTGTINSISWTLGDGSMTTSNNLNDQVQHTYSGPGDYDVTLTITDDKGCTDDATQTLTQHPLPSRIPVDMLDESFCVNSGEVPLSGPEPGTYSYTWTGECVTNGVFDPTCDGTVGNDITTGVAKALQVLIENNSTGCQETYDHTFTIQPIPIAEFAIGDICQFAEFSPMDDSKNGPDSWEWDLDNGEAVITTTTTQAPVFPAFTQLQDTGEHVMRLIVDSDGCRDTVMHTFDLYGLPEAKTRVSIPEDPCPDVDVELRASNSKTTHGGILRYIWDFGDGTMSDTTLENSIFHQYTESNADLRFTVIVGELHANGLVCYDTSSRSMTVLPKPTAAFGVDSALCYTELAVFTNASTEGGNVPILKWEWDLGDGTTISQQEVDDHLYLLPEPLAPSAAYPTSLRVEDENGCFDTAFQVVSVNFSGPTITDAPLKLGDDLLVSRDDGANVTYQWYKVEGNMDSPISGETRQFYCVKDDERSADFVVKTQINGSGCETRSDIGNLGREGLPLDLFFPRGMSLYPNPNQGNFSLELLHEAVGTGELTVLDMAGRTVHAQIFEKTGSLYTLKVNASHLSSGLYIADIRLPNGVWFSRKMMIR